MGLDLNLLPFYAEDCNFSHEVIRFDRDRDMFEWIRENVASRGIKVPDHFTCHMAHYKYEDVDTGYGEVTEDAYGSPLLYVRAGHFQDAIQRHVTQFGYRRFYRYMSNYNKAVFAYIVALPSETKLALYWH